jgi:hypothetical protein
MYRRNGAASIVLARNPRLEPSCGLPSLPPAFLGCFPAPVADLAALQFGEYMLAALLRGLAVIPYVSLVELAQFPVGRAA